MSLCPCPSATLFLHQDSSGFNGDGFAHYAIPFKPRRENLQYKLIDWNARTIQSCETLFGFMQRRQFVQTHPDLLASTCRCDVHQRHSNTVRQPSAAPCILTTPGFCGLPNPVGQVEDWKNISYIHVKHFNLIHFFFRVYESIFMRFLCLLMLFV